MLRRACSLPNDLVRIMAADTGWVRGRRPGNRRASMHWHLPSTIIMPWKQRQGDSSLQAVARESGCLRGLGFVFISSQPGRLANDHYLVGLILSLPIRPLHAPACLYLGRLHERSSVLAVFDHRAGLQAWRLERTHGPRKEA